MTESSYIIVSSYEGKFISQGKLVWRKLYIQWKGIMQLSSYTTISLYGDIWYLILR